MFTTEKLPTSINVIAAFLDITGFHKRITPAYPGEKIFTFLDEMYELIGEVVESAGGKVIKFIGDAALIAFPEEIKADGVATLHSLKLRVDAWLREQGLDSTAQVSVHYGEVTAGMAGTKTDKRFDIFGNTVNTAAVIGRGGGGFVLSPQAFRCLAKEDRARFKKHTPPVIYIPVEERRPR